MRALAVLLLLLAPATAADDRPNRWVADPVLGKRIREAVEKGIAYLRSIQQSDGRWTCWTRPGTGGRLGPVRRPPLRERPRGVVADRPHGWDGGLTALALYAMGASGIQRDDPDVERALAWIRAHPSAFDHTSDVGTYATSLLVLAYARLDAGHFGPEIRTLADRLAASQDDRGLWCYKLTRARARRQTFTPADSARHTPDHSNTQLAVLALWAAHSLSGWQAPRGVWERVERHFREAQQDDGTWTYRPGTTADTNRATMTAAGLACWIYARAAQDGGDEALSRARAAPTARRGLAAFRRALERPDWKDYFLVASIERVATVVALRDASWYEAGARILTVRQEERGFWKGRRARADPRHAYDTALALLFLARATLPPRKGVETAPDAIETMSAREKAPRLAKAPTHGRAFEIYLSLEPDARRAEIGTLGARGPAFVDHLLLVLELDGRKEARAVAHALLERMLDRRLLYQTDAPADARRTMARALRLTWGRMRDDVAWDNETGTYRRH